MHSQSEDIDFTAKINYENCDMVLVDYSCNYQFDEYCWDLGDGRKSCSTSNFLNFRIYKIPGKYTVTFKGILNDDTTTITKKDLIEVYKAPKKSVLMFI